MTIRKGESWGEPVDRPADLYVAGSDRAAGEALSEHPARPVGLSAGDLHRAVGRPPSRTAMQRLPIDALDVTADGHRYTAVAHVVARRSWWRGRVLAAMNVDHFGDWNVAPRAHPNDGRVQVLEVDAAMTVRERWQARSHLVAGTHVPHPRISVRAVSDVAWEFERPSGLWIDGSRVADVRSVSIVVRPDAFTIVV